MAQAEQRPDQAVRGAVIIAATVFAMSSADALIKYVSADLPLWQIYVVRSLIVIPIFTAVAVLGRRPAAIELRSRVWAFLRGMLLAFMYVAIYAGVPVLSLSVIAASLYTGPLFIALFSALLIGEPVGLRRWVAIIVGFAGVLIIIRPAADGFSFLALIPIIAAILYALAAVITRAKCGREAPMGLALALNLSLLAMGGVATGAIAMWGPSPSETAAYPFLLGYWVPMGSREWGIVAALAMLMLGISTGLAKAYQSAPPTVIATFDYAYMVFAVFWSFAVFAEVPDMPTIVGMLMIAGAGLLVIRGRAPRMRTQPDASQPQ